MGKYEVSLTRAETVTSSRREDPQTGDKGEETAVAGMNRRGSMIEEKDVISLAEAKRSTGLLEVWGHELKKLVWA